jgi:hypothetical protein
MSETTDDESKDEPRLMISIDGEPARLLVHIEPIDDTDDHPTETCAPAQAPPSDSPGLAE